MSYIGPSVICKRCGASFSRPSSLKRHRAERRCRGPAKHALARSQAIRGEVLDVSPSRFEIVPSWRESVPARAIPGGTQALAIRKPQGESLAILREQRSRESLRRWSMQPPTEEVSLPLLKEQNMVLDAMASRLDRGAGRPGDVERFNVALAEYKRNGEMFAARPDGRLLPAPIQPQPQVALRDLQSKIVGLRARDGLGLLTPSEKHKLHVLEQHLRVI